MDTNRTRRMEDDEIEAIRAARPHSADPVNAPAHYQGTGGLECVEAIRAAMTPMEFQGFLRGNSFKYLWRFRDKGGSEDLRKARWYLDLLIQAVEAGA